MALILENGGNEGITAAPVMRNILDHIFLPPPDSSVPMQTASTAQVH